MTIEQFTPSLHEEIERACVRDMQRLQRVTGVEESGVRSRFHLIAETPPDRGKLGPGRGAAQFILGPKNAGQSGLPGQALRTKQIQQAEPRIVTRPARSFRILRHAAAFFRLVIVFWGPAAAVSDAAGAPDGLPSEHLFPCLEELLPCTAYLKATSKHPSETCCAPMHRAGGQMPCMCRLLADPELLSTFYVTTAQTFRLPARCALPVGCRDGPDNEPGEP
jgi:hypothetical protein